MKYKLLILGAGCLARDVADLVDDIPEYEVAGFVVDQPPFERGHEMVGKPVYWIDELEDFDHSFRAVCSLGRMKKKRIIQKVKNFGIPFINLIHPSARVSRTASLGEGIFIGVGAQIGAYTEISSHTFINRGTLIGSQDKIMEYCMLSAGVNISGNVTIGPFTYIGIGALVLPHLTIGERCIIGAGSMVTRDVPDRVMVVGNPAVIVEKEIEGF